ncbi:hypothetical protein KJ975_07915 [Myxococcota bacterium]|nr:hypothetical protein [Myxococcota bacterium]
MKRTMMILIALTLPAAAASCRNQGATAPSYTPVLSPAASSVVVLERMTPGCTPQGQIIGRAAAAESGEVVWRYALNDLRNQALARRVTTVFMEKYDHNTEKGLLHIRITGTLLQCGTAGTTDPSPGKTPGEDLQPTPPPPGTDEIEPPPAGDDPEAVTPPPVE